MAKQTIEAKTDAPKAEAEAPKAVHAFRCKTCGRLHHADHAGENLLPLACCVCGAGIKFGGDHSAFAARLRACKTDAEIQTLLADVAKSGGEQKAPDPDNWEVLADAKPERLAELALTPERIARHAPPTHLQALAQDVERIKVNQVQLEKKFAEWEKNKKTHFTEYQKLNSRLLQLDKALPNASAADYARLTADKNAVSQTMKELEDKEPTGRDEAHKLHLESKLAEHQAILAGGDPAERKPQSFFVTAADGAGAGEAAKGKLN